MKTVAMTKAAARRQSHRGSVLGVELKLTPHLFDLFDRDHSGCLSREEVLEGVASMIADHRLSATRQYGVLVKSIMERSDADRSGSLDRKEFGKFLFHLAKALDIPLDQMAEGLVEACLNLDGDSIEHGFEKLDEYLNLIPALFDKYDRSGDGVISRHELSVAMRKIVSDENAYCGSPFASKSLEALSHSDLMFLFDENDTNGDGQLELSEFSTFVSSFSLACGLTLKDAVSFLTEEAGSAIDMDLALEGWKMMPLLFQQFDDNQDGTIDRHEVVEHMEILVQELGLDITVNDIWTIFDSVDENHSHVLDRREFGFFLSAFAKQCNVAVEEITHYLTKLKEKGGSGRPCSHTWTDIEELFEFWDTDNDDHIDRRELFARLSSFRKQSSLSSVEFIKLMNEVDGNQDGVLERSEFSAFLSKFALRAGIELKELTQGLLVECQKECVLLQNDQRGSDSFWDSRGSGSFWDSFTLSLAEEAVETVSRVESTSTMGS